MKRTLALVMFALGLAPAGGCAAARATVPTWVHPGVIVVYDGSMRDLVGISQTRTAAPVETISVTELAGDTVSGTVTIDNDGNPQKVMSWRCAAGVACEGYPAQFWVDPAHPVESVHASNGEPYSVVGHLPYTGPGGTGDSTGLRYQNSGAGIDETLTFVSSSGLIVTVAQTSPTQVSYRHLRSIQGQ